MQKRSSTTVYMNNNLNNNKHFLSVLTVRADETKALLYDVAVISRNLFGYNGLSVRVKQVVI